MMKKQESLNILNSVYEQMKAMTEDELFNYLMIRSESFRKDAEDFKNTVELTEHKCTGNFNGIYFRNEITVGEFFPCLEESVLPEDCICLIAA